MEKQIRKANNTVVVIQFIGLNIEITKVEQQRKGQLSDIPLLTANIFIN